MLDFSLVPSATWPNEIILPTRLLSDFPVVFKGYA